MPNKIRIATNAAPPSMGTHSQAIRTGDLVFLTGQTGRDPETGLLEEGLEAQTHRMLSNIDAVLNAAGCTPADIVKVTLLLTDIKNFKAVDQIYATGKPRRVNLCANWREIGTVTSCPSCHQLSRTRSS